MKKTVRKLAAALLAAGLYAGGTLAAEWQTDIVGQTAVGAFKAMLAALPSQPAANETDKLWMLDSPDGKAAFWWRKEANGSRAFDAYLCFDAEAFVKAGLKLDKLPAEMKGMLDRGWLTIGKKLSGAPLVYGGEITPLTSFEQIVKLDRESVGYHAALDHYGVTLADGWLVEWAKDLAKNDKDLVFVLDPKLLIDAGVDPARVEGWIYTKVPLEDARGRKFEAEKFLKPFNLK